MNRVICFLLLIQLHALHRCQFYFKLRTSASLSQLLGKIAIRNPAIHESKTGMNYNKTAILFEARKTFKISFT